MWQARRPPASQPRWLCSARSYPQRESNKRLLRSTRKSHGCAMVAKPIGCELYNMKRIKLLSLVTIALVTLAQPTWAGHGGGGGFGGGGHFGGGGYVCGGFVSGRFGWLGGVGNLWGVSVG